MTSLHRHQLCWLTAEGWQRILARKSDATEHACLLHWSVQRLPLVVTQQSCSHAACEPGIAVGLPAPARWERRRISLRVALHEVSGWGEFPCAAEVAPLLADTPRGAWRGLCTQLDACRVIARVYGSYGWQTLTGLEYLRSSSDIDLWAAVANFERADAAVAALQGFADASLRIDGELVFVDHEAVAWREWLAWRAGRTQALLVKTIAGTSLSRSMHARYQSAEATQ